MRWGRKRLSLEERFWANVAKAGDDQCWLWIASKRGDYGQIVRSGKNGPWDLVHRLSWKMHFGEIPTGLFVLHRCDQPVCVNPSHLFLGTQAVNMADMAAKGRRAVGEKHGCAKLTNQEAQQIRLATGFHEAIAMRFGISRSTVGRIKAGKSWKDMERGNE